MSSRQLRLRRRRRQMIIGLTLAVGLVGVAGVALWADGNAGSGSATPPAATKIVIDTQAPGLDAPVIAFLGDSYTYGARASSPNLTYTKLVCETREVICDINAESGTGYINKSTTEGQARFVDRVEAFQHDDGIPPDLIIVQGGLNDPGNKADVKKAAAETFAALHRLYPEADIMAVGPVAAPRFDPADLDAVREGIAAAAQAEGVTFVDPIADNWIPSGPYFDKDRTHLNDAGYKLFADRLLAEIPPEIAVTSK